MTDIVDLLNKHAGTRSDVDAYLHACAADEIKRLRAALIQFVALCDTAPPTSLIIELGMACKVARRALTLEDRK